MVGMMGRTNLDYIFDSDDKMYHGSLDAASGQLIKPTQKFRDPSAWYHIVLQ
jgi:hypothetical protein